MKNKPSIVLNEPAFYVLLALSKENLSGYELTRVIFEITKGRLEVKTGIMYPMLKKLDDLRLIKLVDEEQGRNKKIYILTNEGHKILNEEIQRIQEKVDEINVNELHDSQELINIIDILKADKRKNINIHLLSTGK